MPGVYRCPASKLDKPGWTTYLVPVGEGTVFSAPEGRRLQDITDGTSKTILAVDASDESAVPWTKPDDWRFQAEQPTKGLFGHYDYGFVAAFCDGSVRVISKSADMGHVRAAFTERGGEPLDDF